MAQGTTVSEFGLARRAALFCCASTADPGEGHYRRENCCRQFFHDFLPSMALHHQPAFSV
jgi:hypothetical protein